MRAPSFLDILTEKLRQDLRAEIQAEIQAEVEARLDTNLGQRKGREASPATPPAAKDVESWLLTRAGKTTFSRVGAAQRAYQGAPRTKTEPPPPPREPPRERTACATTAEEIFAFEYLLRFAEERDVDPNAFTESELKSLWRQAALKTHPDRARGDRQTQLLFMQAKEAYALLRALLS